MEKRFLIVALCMCFILSNTACGKAKESKTENNETSTEPTEKTGEAEETESTKKTVEAEVAESTKKTVRPK